MNSAEGRNRVSTAKFRCAKGEACFFEKSLKIIVMGLKSPENGEPQDPFLC